MPLIDPDTGAVLDRDLVGSLDRLERDAEGRLVVVDLKTAARKYSDLQVEASLQLSVYSYAMARSGVRGGKVQRGQGRGPPGAGHQERVAATSGAASRAL